MHKSLMVVGLVVLAADAVADDTTKIRAENVDAPVHVGVFTGVCGDMELEKLANPDNFTFVAGRSCQYVMKQTLDPAKPNQYVETWHEESVPLNLVAFQDGGAPIQCLIKEHKTMYIVGGQDGLTCTSREPEADDTEEGTATDSPTDVTGDMNANQPGEPATDPETDGNA